MWSRAVVSTDDADNLVLVELKWKISVLSCDLHIIHPGKGEIPVT